MIQFSQFITEAANLLGTDGVDNFVNHIKSKCKPWLTKSKGLLLYRGMSSFNSDVFIEKLVRKDRKSNSGLKLATIKKIDRAFNKLFKIRGMTKCVFTTGNAERARAFGNVYVIFPEGKFEYIWSDRIRDVNFQFTWDYEKYDEILKRIEMLYFKNPDLPKAIKSGNEIMIDCKSYCGVSIKQYDKIKGLLK